MVQIFWRELYCNTCDKVTNHRHSIKGNTELKSRNVFGAYNNPDTIWECWSCRTKKKKSTRKAPHMFEEGGSYITVYVKKMTQEEAQKNPERAAIDSLAQVVSYLEDRLTYVEDCLTIEKRKRGIRVKNQEE